MTSHTQHGHDYLQLGIGPKNKINIIGEFLYNKASKYFTQDPDILEEDVSQQYNNGLDIKNDESCVGCPKDDDIPDHPHPTDGDGSRNGGFGSIIVTVLILLLVAVVAAILYKYRENGLAYIRRKRDPYYAKTYSTASAETEEESGPVYNISS